MHSQGTKLFLKVKSNNKTSKMSGNNNTHSFNTSNNIESDNNVDNSNNNNNNNNNDLYLYYYDDSDEEYEEDDDDIVYDSSSSTTDETNVDEGGEDLSFLDKTFQDKLKDPNRQMTEEGVSNAEKVRLKQAGDNSIKNDIFSNDHKDFSGYESKSYKGGGKVRGMQNNTRDTERPHGSWQGSLEDKGEGNKHPSNVKDPRVQHGSNNRNVPWSNWKDLNGTEGWKEASTNTSTKQQYHGSSMLLSLVFWLLVFCF